MVVPSGRRGTETIPAKPSTTKITMIIDSPPDPDDEANLLLPISKFSSSPDGGGDDEASEKIAVFDVSEVGDDNLVPVFSWRKLWAFTGPGFLMSIAFLDPGNLEGDLQSGAIAGYSLTWLLLWATAMGLLIQLLSARLGVVTGRNLAELCREEYPKWARYSLWFMAEVALIAADIQEVIGSAIAIQVLTNGVVPLWAGILLMSSDCFMFLLLESYGVRKLEAVFAVLIGTMALTFAWMFFETKPNGQELLVGLLLPRLSSKTAKQAVGTVGCVITPHNVFLHSALVQSRQVHPRNKSHVQEALTYYTIESSAALFIMFTINLCVTSVFAEAFHGTKEAESIGLINAGKYLQERRGSTILYMWGIGLLAAGQSSTITGTYAGQFIMGGFIDLPVKKWMRSLITRSCAIVPTVFVALVFNSSEDSLDVLNEWLNVLQSIQIPFALIPLLTMVSSERIMGEFKIGTILEKTAWSMAGLLMVINGYIIIDFFVSEGNRGLLFGFAACIGTGGYLSFIFYLVARRKGAVCKSWMSLEMSSISFSAQN